MVGGESVLVWEIIILNKNKMAWCCQSAIGNLKKNIYFFFKNLVKCKDFNKYLQTAYLM